MLNKTDIIFLCLFFKHTLGGKMVVSLLAWVLCKALFGIEYFSPSHAQATYATPFETTILLPPQGWVSQEDFKADTSSDGEEFPQESPEESPEELPPQKPSRLKTITNFGLGALELAIPLIEKKMEDKQKERLADEALRGGSVVNGEEDGGEEAVDAAGGGGGGIDSPGVDEDDNQVGDVVNVPNTNTRPNVSPSVPTPAPGPVSGPPARP